MKIGNQKIQITNNRIFIGVAGGSAAGKTTLCETINRNMAFDRNFKVETISLDSFYRSIDKSTVDISEYNFDHPLSLDFDLAFQVLQTLKNSDQPVPIPQYSFTLHQRLPQPQLIFPANIYLFEGLMAFYDERIRNMLTYKIFINCDDDIRLCRRIKRDTTERNRTIQSVLMQYNKFVKNSFKDFIYPTVSYADLIIPGSRNNRISVDFIVEHIKNVAKKKNLFSTAQETKVFLFGENEYYNCNVNKNYHHSIQHHRQPFCVFPTSNEHRRELDFFLNFLMANSFTQQYFNEVYIFQFIKTIRSLLKQLFELKNIDVNQIELISIHEIREKLRYESNKPIKIIFLHAIFQKEQNLLSDIKSLINKNMTIIVINIFCHMMYPNKVYEADIDGLVFINLFLIANKKRFIDILLANNLSLNQTEQQKGHPEEWFFDNNILVEKGLLLIANEFGIKYEKLDWKLEYSLMLSYAKEQLKESKTKDFYSLNLNLENKSQHEWVDKVSNRKIQQVISQPQEHPSLCGFYALHNIKEFQQNQQFLSKEAFVQNYMKFNRILEQKSENTKYLKTPLFQSLERSQVPLLIYDLDVLPNEKISVLFLSQNYIVNDKQSLEDLKNNFFLLKSSQIKVLFLLMGVYSHYFVLRLNNDGNVIFIDSMNTNLRHIMSATGAQSGMRERQMRISIETVVQLYYTDVTVDGMLVRLRIDQILGSYYSYKQKGELQKWFEDQYILPVLKYDLFDQMKQVTEEELGDRHIEILKKWFDEQFVKHNIAKTDDEQHPLKKFKNQ